MSTAVISFMRIATYVGRFPRIPRSTGAAFLYTSHLGARKQRAEMSGLGLLRKLMQLTYAINSREMRSRCLIRELGERSTVRAAVRILTRQIAMHAQRCLLLVAFVSVAVALAVHVAWYGVHEDAGGCKWTCAAVRAIRQRSREACVVVEC